MPDFLHFYSVAQNTSELITVSVWSEAFFSILLLRHTVLCNDKSFHIYMEEFNNLF